MPKFDKYLQCRNKYPELPMQVRWALLESNFRISMLSPAVYFEKTTRGVVPHTRGIKHLHHSNKFPFLDMDFRAQLWRQHLPLWWYGHRAERWMEVKLFCTDMVSDYFSKWRLMLPIAPCPFAQRGGQATPSAKSAPLSRALLKKFLNAQCPTSQWKTCIILFYQGWGK